MDTLEVERAVDNGGGSGSRTYNRVQSGEHGGEFASTNTAGSSSARAPLTPGGTYKPRAKTGGGSSKPSLPASSKFKTLGPGEDNDPAAVAEMQQLLSALGLGSLEANGQYDGNTTQAVMEAQKRLGLKPTGKANKSLVNKLLNAYDLSPCVKRSEDLDPDDIERRRPYPGQKYTHGWVKVGAPGLGPSPNVNDAMDAHRAFNVEINGLTARVNPGLSETYKTYVEGEGSQVVHRVAGEIRNGDGEIVGSFRRLLYPKTRTVHNDSLGIDDDYQRRGFATQFNDRAEQILAEMGYTRATVSPTLSGGYVWARRGYDWDSTAKRPPYGDVPEHIVAQLEKTKNPSQRRQMQDWLDGFSSGDPSRWPTPREIADSPMGRDILTGAMWQGEKDLTSQIGHGRHSSR